MALQIGDLAPDFEAQTTEGHSLPCMARGLLGSALLPPEGLHAGVYDRVRYMAKLKPEFDKRHVKIIGLSVDPVENHTRWSQDIKQTQGRAPNYPMIGDTDLKVSKLYGMLSATLEGTSRMLPANIITTRRDSSESVRTPTLAEHAVSCEVTFPAAP